MAGHPAGRTSRQALTGCPLTAIGLGIGEQAPDFELPDHRGGKIRLSRLRGDSAVLLVFFPFAFTNVCTSELVALGRRLETLQEHGVRVLAVSCDSPYALAAFAEREHVAIELLSDFWPHGEVTRAYGLLLEDKGFAMRGSFLIDRDGRIAWSVVQGPADERDADAYVEALGTLS